MSTLADRLNIVIKEKGIKQVDLMDMNGKKFTQSAVNAWFTGKAQPNRNNLKLIANYLGVNVKWLITGEGEKAENIVVESDNNIKNYVEDLENEYIKVNCKELLKMYYDDIEVISKLLQNKQRFFGAEINKIKG